MTAVPSSLPWEAVEAVLHGILDRRYYTNHGPLAAALETALAEAYGVVHAMPVTNPAIALAIMLDAFSLSGTVLVASTAPGRCRQAIRWAGLEALVCDGGPAGQLTPLAVARALQPGCSAILASAMGGTALSELAAFAEASGLALCTDGDPGPASPVPAMVTLPLSAGQPDCACILTDDDAYAGRIRNIRSSYGTGPRVAVKRTANGRISELQAGIALHQLGQRRHPRYSGK